MFSASTKSGKNPTGGGADPQFNYVTMLLHGDGTNGAQNNTFIDSSTNAFSITRNGNTTQGSFSPYGSNWSNYFDGTGDYLTVGYNSAISVGSGNFTIEMWIAPVNSQRATLYIEGGDRQGIFIDYNNGNNGISVFATATVGLWNIIDGDPGNAGYGSSNTITLNQWNHFAFVRNGTNWSTYINGVRDLNLTASGTVYESGGSRYISFFPSLGFNLFGYVSNFRLVKGTALYSGATITVPTAPLTAVSGTGLLTCQANRFTDNSGNSLTVTPTGNTSVQRFNPFGASTAYSTSVIGGSGFFDGTGDSLSCTGSLPSTADFTLSLWTYPVSLSGYTIAIEQSGSGNFFYLYLGYADGMVDIQIGNSAYTDYTAGVYKANQWNYVQIVKSSSAFSVYVNGTALSNIGGIGNIGTTSIATGTLTVRYNVNCYITDVRIVTSALSNVVPTAPLTAVSGTTTLLNMTNGAIFDNAMMNDLETVGNAQISTSVVKYGTGSLYFDGVGDALRGQNNTPNLQFFTGNFTVECWLYQTAINSYPSVMEIGDHISAAGGILFIASGGSTITAYNGAVGFLGSATAPALNTWNHIAWVRNNGVFKIYVNGVGNAGVAFTQNLNTSTTVTIGAEQSLDSGYTYTGYIDDLRITKGYARYTANFTPPIAAFLNTGPT